MAVPDKLIGTGRGDGPRWPGVLAHTSDPVADDHAHDAFDLFRILDHKGTRGARSRLLSRSWAWAPQRERRHRRGMSPARATAWCQGQIVKAASSWFAAMPCALSLSGGCGTAGARGKLHMLAGSPGAGKSTIALTLAAVATAGGRWPDGTECTPGHVLVWSGEDDPADTLLPRLLAAGGDPKRRYSMDRVHRLTIGSGPHAGAASPRAIRPRLLPRTRTANWRPPCASDSRLA
jgi:hypothetical protein